MQKIFSCSQASELEKLAKENYAIPPFLMMENAARAMADFVFSKEPTEVLIVCGKGNNGGDGYALARLLQGRMNVTVFALEAAATGEAKAQFEMCKRLDIKILTSSEKSEMIPSLEKICNSLSTTDFIIDCIYGTGFHGSLSPDVEKIINIMNKSPAQRLACDIPSGLEFNADYTITMGCQKLALYSDKAKAVTGLIKVAELGISREKFEEFENSNIYLIEPDDRKLPIRKNRAAHKGKYGHTAIMCGDKAGAAILAASAAMNFGSGLTSLVKTESSNIEQFKVSPSLMISDTIPEKTSCLALGSGFTEFPKDIAESLLEWFKSSKAPAAVLDAGLLTSPESPQFLQKLNEYNNARIVITPHLSELSRLLKACEADIDSSIESLAESPEARIDAGKFLTKLYPQTTIIMKSANTFIASKGDTFIITDGSQALAKGGSGDILAGLTAALLAQGYTGLSAAITATEHHALLSKEIGADAYNLTPEKLISLI